MKHEIKLFNPSVQGSLARDVVTGQWQWVLFSTLLFTVVYSIPIGSVVLASGTLPPWLLLAWIIVPVLWAITWLVMPLLHVNKMLPLRGQRDCYSVYKTMPKECQRAVSTSDKKFIKNLSTLTGDEAYELEQAMRRLQSEYYGRQDAMNAISPERQLVQAWIEEIKDRSDAYELEAKT